MDNIVDYCESSSPEESEKERDAAAALSKTDGNVQRSKNSSTDSSSSEDKSVSPETVQQQKRPSHRERSRSRSPQRHDHRPLPYRRNSYGRRSRSGSRERDRRRRSRSSSRDRDLYRRRRSRSGSQEKRRRSSRSRSPDRRGRYNRSPPRQYRRSPPSRYRRSGWSRSRSPPVSRRYPSTPVVTAHTLSRNASGGDAQCGSLSNIPGETPEQKLENALTTMNQRQARYGGMTALQFQAVQEKRKQLWKKKTPASAATHWDAYAATFGQPSTAGNIDSNEDPQAKFRRLMGMKGDSKQQNQDVTQKSSEIINQQNKLLADLDQQYEESRFLTHRARGVGFGFGGTVLSNLSKTQDVVNEKGPEDK